MPPPDTTSIPGVTGTLQSVGPMGDSLLKESHSRLVPQANDTQFLLPQWLMFLIIVVILMLLYLYQVRTAVVTARRKKNLLLENANHLLLKKGNQYAGWFSEFNPYYNTLSEELKGRFLFRVAEFMQSKKFIYHSIGYDEKIPVLISGAAVQLTFGLNNFLMDYFSVVHVMGKEYVLNIDNDTYFGHVSKNGIHVAWNHFLKGYADYKDSINVGLHEMAHAVSYDVFLGQQDKHDSEFKQRLEDFSENGIQVFRAMRKGASHVLNDYGATNFDEFWAVCVETFFENAEEFKRTEPELYVSISELLNQDPLTDKKIIDPGLAGMVP